jgi:hypothetical protein
VLSLLFTAMIRRILSSLVMFALIGLTRGFSADRVAVLIDAVAQKAQAASRGSLKDNWLRGTSGSQLGTSREFNSGFRSKNLLTFPPRHGRAWRSWVARTR